MNERELLAAELAFGLLHGADRTEALRLRLADAEFASLVVKWEHLAASWYDELPDMELPEDLWRGIEERISGEQTAGKVRVLPLSAGRGWRNAALAASTAALAFAGLWVLAPRTVYVTEGTGAQGASTSSSDDSGTPSVAARDPRPITVTGSAALEPGELSVAQIAQSNDGELISAVYDRRNGRLLLRLAPVGDPARVPVLWRIGADGSAESLGQLEPGQAVALELQPEVRRAFDQGATIAVSLEQPAESYSAPRGPILGKAAMSTI